MKVLVKGPNLKETALEFPLHTSVEQVLNTVKDQMPYPIYLCKLDNIYRGLGHDIHHDCHIEFLDIREQASWLVYQNSLTLLLLKAVHDLFGKDVQVTINNSLNKGLYIRSTIECNKENLKRIEDYMVELVKKDLPIVKEYLSVIDAKKLALELNQKETYKLLDSAKSLKNVEIYSLINEIQIFYSILVPHTSYLDKFELREYKGGMLLRYPHPNNPLEIPPYVDQTILYNAFKETSNWGKLMGVHYVDSLNEITNKEDVEELFLIQEALHEKTISDIADQIAKLKKRIVLICGPSSSGKTTFAKRLCIQLRVNGIKPLYLGTDDYFVEREETPLDENGEKDYESIKAVDTKLFISDLQNLLDGKTVDLPYFDFVKGGKIFGTRLTKINKNQVIVIEGIHALNKTLTNGIDDKEKYKIYISPFSPVSIDRHNRIPSTDARMLRRLVRDYQFRNRPANTTLNDWIKVRAGEEKNIFPFSDEADFFFNSNSLYELAILKKYAEPLLNQIKRSEPEYAEAQRLLSFLRFIDSIDDTSKIPANSILREFIGKQ